MQIHSSNLSMASSYQAVTALAARESLRVPSAEPTAAPAAVADSVELSGEVPPADDPGEITGGEPTPAEGELKLSIASRLLERLTGKAFDSKALREFVRDDVHGRSACAPGHVQRLVAQAPRDGAFQYDYEQARVEQRSFAFAASGVIETKDGQQLDFAVSLSMSRTFLEEQSIHIERGDAGDLDAPLLVRYDGTAAELTTTQFALSLGGTEEVSGDQGEDGLLAPPVPPAAYLPDAGQAAGQQVDVTA